MRLSPTYKYMSTTEKFLISYLDCIGIKNSHIKANDDTMGLVISVEIPQTNSKRIGTLRGKKGQNLLLLKRMLKVVGLTEGKNPTLIVRLTN